MRLAELQPRWVHENIFIFLCPHCQKVWLSCKNAVMDRHAQYELFQSIEPPLYGAIVPTKPEFAWSISGREFDTMTVAPSLDASPSGHWHGHIKAGGIA